MPLAWVTGDSNAEILPPDRYYLHFNRVYIFYISTLYILLLLFKLPKYFRYLSSGMGSNSANEAGGRGLESW